MFSLLEINLYQLKYFELIILYPIIINDPTKSKKCKPSPKIINPAINEKTI